MTKDELKQTVLDEIYNVLVEKFESKQLNEGAATRIVDLILKIVEKNRMQTAMTQVKKIDPEIAKKIGDYKRTSKALKAYLAQDYRNNSAERRELLDTLKSVNKK